MRIKVIIPNSGMDRSVLTAREKMLSRAVSQECEISVDYIADGPVSIESNADEYLASVQLLKKAIQAERDGFEAVVIYCFSDLAIHAVRECVSIPVIGPGAAAISVADMVSVRFTVITTAEKNVPRTTRRLMENPICREKMACVRAMNIPVEDLRVNPDVTKAYLEKVCRDAMEIDGADTVVLGCLGFAGYGEEIAGKLGITILDPSGIAVSAAEVCLRNKICHNRFAYPSYERKNLI